MQYSWTVHPEDSGKKLVEFIQKHLPEVSARQIKKSIESNACTINGRFERFASTVLGSGDVVSFQLTTAKRSLTIDKSSILYEDKDFLIINKPAGVASDDPQLANALGKGLQLVHRLDKETSGALMFAKSSAVFEDMVVLFRQKAVEKTYLAIVDGVPNKPSGIMDNYLGKVHSFQGQSLWGSVEPHRGQHARTEWQLQRSGAQASLVLCRPITGRTHQIRVHMAGMGHPILGDHQYGRKFRCGLRVDRMMLHAYVLKFKDIHVEAPIPEDMQTVINSL